MVASLEYRTKGEMYKDIKQLLKWLLSTDLHGISIGELNKLDGKYYDGNQD